MIELRMRDQLSTAYEDRVLVHDADSFSVVYDYLHLLTDLGYEVIQYSDVEQFRFIYETEIKGNGKKVAVIDKDHYYIPYDIRKAFYEVTLSFESIYPKLNSGVIKEHMNDLGLIDLAYDTLYEDSQSSIKTTRFIEQSVLSADNINQYIEKIDAILQRDADTATTSTDWISIAKRNANLEVYAALIGKARNQQYINDRFASFILDGYQKLSGILSKDVPAILPKAIDIIAVGKTALLVADGMSLFDFDILSRYLAEFEYDYNCSFALIPTTTSISRQSLLSGKYPQQLENPFSLTREESGFYEAAAAHGYNKQQTFYGRGYDAMPGPFIRFAAVIINDFDDMVHGQKQGRPGMYNDDTLLAKTGKIQELIMRLINQGFSVYLTADHGNTSCIGCGAVKRAGVETETKSKRMVVLKDFAEVSDELSERTFLYPGYYMDKSYQYRICKNNTSFDNKNEDVMTHGGITIEEVIVPFVKIRRKING